MVLNSKPEQKSSGSVLQIKQDDKFFCRLLSKESSMSNPSFRVSASVAVPFVWESQPGTPKYTFSENTLPPLTPPPSYQYSNNNNNNKIAFKNPQEKVKKILRPFSAKTTNIFMTLFPKLNLKKMTLSGAKPSSKSSSLSSPSSLSCSSLSSINNNWWSSSDHSSKVVPMAKIGRRRFLSYGSSSFDFRGDHHHHNNEEEDNSNNGGGGSGSPSSTLCFGIPRATSSISTYKRRA